MINLDYLNDVTGNDFETKKQLIELFFSQEKEIAANLKNAMENCDYENLSKIAHLAKSTLKIMGINDVSDKMKELQELASQNIEHEKYQSIIDFYFENMPLALKELEQEIK